jgi:oligopeptidase B
VLVAARRPLIQYSVDASHGSLWILTNDDHVNFRIAEADPATPGDWRTIIAGSDEVYLRGLTAFRDHLAISERVDGLDQISCTPMTAANGGFPFGEPAYTVSLGANPEYAPAAYRLSYSSMVTPPTVYDYHAEENRLETLKVQPIPSGYDPGDYVTERVIVPSRDGQRIPVSIVYRRGFERNGRGGSSSIPRRYGIPRRPAFNTPDTACSTPRLCLRHRPPPRRRPRWAMVVSGRTKPTHATPPSKISSTPRAG